MYLAHWLFSLFVFNERFKVISMHWHHFSPHKLRTRALAHTHARIQKVEFIVREQMAKRRSSNISLAYHAVHVFIITANIPSLFVNYYCLSRNGYMFTIRRIVCVEPAVTNLSWNYSNIDEFTTTLLYEILNESWLVYVAQLSPLPLLLPRVLFKHINWETPMHVKRQLPLFRLGHLKICVSSYRAAQEHNAEKAINHARVHRGGKRKQNEKFSSLSLGLATFRNYKK